MSTINGISGQRYIAPQSSATKSAATQTSSRATADYYVPGGSSAVQTEVKAKAFTATMASDLAGKYDVRNMSRNEYTKLLAELRDSGALTSQEYSIAYGGTMPTDNENVSWPHGSEMTDFIQLLQDCEASCADYAANSILTDREKANGEMLTDAYSRLQEIFQQIGGTNQAEAAQSTDEAESTSADVTPLTKEQQEVERLTTLLKADEAFGGNTYRRFINYPAGRELATAMIMADEDLQAQIADRMSISTSEMKTMLHSKDRLTATQVLIGYYGVLNHKARTVGLTETEKLLDDRLERTNLVAQGTFNERMQVVQKEIEQSFQEQNISVDQSKSYSFHLDTTTFTFSVTGGTDEENSIMESIVNTSKNRVETLSALYGHRRDNGQYNPWMVDTLLYRDEVVPKYGVASVSDEYSNKMKALYPALNQYRLDSYLRDRYGFGIDDISYVGGTFVGRTDEITQQIASMGLDFLMYGGGSYLADIHAELLDRYGFGLHEVEFAEDGSLIGRTDEIDEILENAGETLLEDIKRPDKIDVPVFEKPVFVFVNGEFKVTYEEWE